MPMFLATQRALFWDSYGELTQEAVARLGHQVTKLLKPVSVVALGMSLLVALSYLFIVSHFIILH